MPIRHAREDDLPVLLSMCGRFLHASRYSGVLRDVPEAQARVLQYLFDVDGFFVLENDREEVVGMIGFGLVPVPWTGDLSAHEVMWWVEPEERKGRTALSMLDEAEAWARERGALSIQMIEPVGGSEGLGHIYARRGYTPLEITWHKPLGGA